MTVLAFRSAAGPIISPRRWAWLTALVSGIVLSAVAVSASLPAAALAAGLSGALPVVAVAVALRWHRPVRPRPWITLGVGLALYWMVATPRIAGLLDEGSLVAMILTVAGYTCILGGVIGVLSDRSDGDVSTLLEALILATAAALIVWLLVLAPIRDADTSRAAADTIGALAYPALDLAMFALAGRALVQYRHIGASLWLLLPALLASAATDAAGLLSFASGTPVPQWLALGGSLVANGFVAAAALHPSLARPVLGDPRHIENLLRVRVALVGAATLIAPAMMLFREYQAHTSGRHVDSPEVGVGALVIAVLVVADLYLLLHRLDASLRVRMALEGELQRLALSDSLTTLPNRAAFLARLERSFARHQEGVALLFCDLDDFKTVNDTLGHAAGDALLVEVGERLRQAVRPSDLAARLGGDEFAVVLGHIARPEDAETVAGRIIDGFRKPFIVAGREFTVRISIGIAFGREVDTTSDLMRDADIAMYLAKGKGKGRFERYRAEASAGTGTAEGSPAGPALRGPMAEVA